MPGLISHYLCGEAALLHVSAEAAHSIERYRRLYNVGTQGPDIFFYYMVYVLRKKQVNPAQLMHNQNTGAFICELIRLADELPAAERQAALAYLSGYLTHYNLDCAAHPYIYYKTGVSRNASAPVKLRHSALHRSFETNIDTALLKLLKNEKPTQHRLWQLVYTDGRTSRPAAEIISKALKSCYGLQVSEKNVTAAIRHMWLMTAVLQSNSGKRRRLLGFLEDKTSGARLLSSLIHNEQPGGKDFLNLAGNEWFLPWDNSKSMTSSFIDMFTEAVEKSVEMINMLYTDVENRPDFETLSGKIGNRSLTSGLDSDIDIEFKYFENN